MVVFIEFFGTLRAVTKKARIDMSITEKTKVRDALEYARQKYPALHLEEGMVLITVNHKLASLDRTLRAEDTVSFLPPIGGG